MSSPRDDAWMGLALEELLDGLQMGHRPQPSPLTPLSVAGIRRRIPSAEQVDVPPDHRFGPIRVDTTPPRPRPVEAAHTPADQGKQPNTDQGPPPLVPLHTTRAPSTQATQKQTTEGRPSPRAAPETAGPSTRPHTGQLPTTPTGKGQPPRAAPRATAPSTRPHTGRATTMATGHATPSPRATPRVALTAARARTGPTPTAPGTRAVQAVAAPDPDGEEAALRVPRRPSTRRTGGDGPRGRRIRPGGPFRGVPDEDGVELPTRPVSNQSTDEPRTPSPQFQPDYEEISSDEGVAAEIIQISDSDDAEPSFRPPGTPPPAYEDIFGPGPYATSCPIPTCAASTPSQSPPTRHADGPATSRLVDLTTDEDSANEDSASERPAVAVPTRPPLPIPGEYAAAVARRRAEELSDELGSSSAGPVRPTNPEPRSARDRPPHQHQHAEAADGAHPGRIVPADPRPRRSCHAIARVTPAGYQFPTAGARPTARYPPGSSGGSSSDLIARRRARRYLEEEQGQRFRVQLNRDDHVRVFLHPTRK
nr:mucin-2-like [Drosophila kikkawai]